MKNQALFSSKDKSKKFKCRLLQFSFGALRVNDILLFVGHYMYIEASAPRKQGDKARLMSPTYTDNSAICVQFWYHMYGNGIGTLNVYAQVG